MRSPESGNPTTRPVQSRMIIRSDMDTRRRRQREASSCMCVWPPSGYPSKYRKFRFTDTDSNVLGWERRKLSGTHSAANDNYCLWTMFCEDSKQTCMVVITSNQSTCNRLSVWCNYVVIWLRSLGSNRERNLRTFGSNKITWNRNNLFSPF